MEAGTEKAVALMAEIVGHTAVGFFVGGMDGIEETLIPKAVAGGGKRTVGILHKDNGYPGTAAKGKEGNGEGRCQRTDSGSAAETATCLKCLNEATGCMICSYCLGRHTATTLHLCIAPTARTVTAYGYALRGDSIMEMLIADITYLKGLSVGLVNSAPKRPGWPGIEQWEGYQTNE